MLPWPPQTHPAYRRSPAAAVLEKAVSTSGSRELARHRPGSDSFRAWPHAAPWARRSAREEQTRPARVPSARWAGGLPISGRSLHPSTVRPKCIATAQRGDDRGDVVGLGMQIVAVRFLVRLAPAAKIRCDAAVVSRHFSDDEVPRPSGAAPVVEKDQRRLLVSDIANVEVQPLD